MGRSYGGEGTIGSDSSKVISGQGKEVQIRFGTHTNVTAVDTVVTGLNFVQAVVVSLRDDPAASADVGLVSATPGDQAGTPAAGSILIKSWEIDATVATTFGEEIDWIAIGY
jgi:hypothetical protein